MRRGFTLIELMLVVIIIGILVGMVVPRLVGRSEEARKTAAKADIQGSIATALDLYEMDIGSFPSSDEGLGALCNPERLEDKKRKRWKGPYLKNCPEDGSIPLDPWGNEYRYVYPFGDERRKMYKLWSMGPDEEDNDGVGGDDISNIPKKGEENP